MMMMMTASILSALLLKNAYACEISSQQIDFGTLGVQTAWYCKATADERRQALRAMAAFDCIPQKLAEQRRPVLEAVAVDVIPYWFTKADAAKAGPILDCRLTLTRSEDQGNEKRTGFRALATAKDFGRPGPLRFDLTEASNFVRTCPPTGCDETFTTLCAE